MVRIFDYIGDEKSFRVYYIRGGLYVHLIDIIDFMGISNSIAEDYIIGNASYDKIEVDGIILYNVSTIRKIELNHLLAGFNPSRFIQWCDTILDKICKKFNSVLYKNEVAFTVKDFKICISDVVESYFLNSNRYDEYLISGINKMTKHIAEEDEKIYTTFRYVSIDFEKNSDLDRQVAEYIFEKKKSISWKLFRYLVKKDIKRFKFISMEHCFNIIQGNSVKGYKVFKSEDDI